MKPRSLLNFVNKNRTWKTLQHREQSSLLGNSFDIFSNTKSPAEALPMTNSGP